MRYLLWMFSVLWMASAYAETNAFAEDDEVDVFESSMENAYSEVTETDHLDQREGFAGTGLESWHDDSMMTKSNVIPGYHTEKEDYIDPLQIDNRFDDSNIEEAADIEMYDDVPVDSITGGIDVELLEAARDVDNIEQLETTMDQYVDIDVTEASDMFGEVDDEHMGGTTSFDLLFMSKEEQVIYAKDPENVDDDEALVVNHVNYEGTNGNEEIRQLIAAGVLEDRQYSDTEVKKLIDDGVISDTDYAGKDSPYVHELADQDMDTKWTKKRTECGIWLCLPQGFPKGCGKSADAFWDRIKDFKPPLRPLHECLVSSGASNSSNPQSSQHSPVVNAALDQWHGKGEYKAPNDYKPEMLPAAYIPPAKYCSWSRTEMIDAWYYWWEDRDWESETYGQTSEHWVGGWTKRKKCLNWEQIHEEHVWGVECQVNVKGNSNNGYKISGFDNSPKHCFKTHHYVKVNEEVAPGGEATCPNPEVGCFEKRFFQWKSGAGMPVPGGWQVLQMINSIAGHPKKKVWPHHHSHGPGEPCFNLIH